MIKIFSDKITNKLIYTCDYIFSDHLGLNYSITSNLNDFLNFDGIKINYSANYYKNTINIFPQNLLFEKNISLYKKPPTSIHPDFKLIIFPYQEFNPPFYTIPFDIFSAIFWILSRIEEYFSISKDNFGRFDYKNSIFFHHNTLKYPIISHWLKMFIFKINQFLNCSLSYKPNYKIKIIIDVDSLFGLKFKSFLRKFALIIKFLFNKDFDFFIRSFNFFTQKKDPFDTFDAISELSKIINVKPILFILINLKKTKYDRNLLPTKKFFIEKIKDLSKNFEIGLHSSFYSIERNTLLKEKQILESIVNKEITKHRFHYLRITDFSKNYSFLENSGFTEDYSLSYPDIISYRAGTTFPFKYFNLIEDKITNLTIYPVTFMDTYFIKKKQLKEYQVTTEILEILSHFKEFGGIFVISIHNNNFRKINDIEFEKVWYKILLDATSNC